MYIVCFGDLLNTEHFHALYTALLLVIVDYILRLPRVAFHVLTVTHFIYMLSCYVLLLYITLPIVLICMNGEVHIIP